VTKSPHPVFDLHNFWVSFHPVVDLHNLVVLTHPVVLNPTLRWW